MRENGGKEGGEENGGLRKREWGGGMEEGEDAEERKG